MRFLKVILLISLLATPCLALNDAEKAIVTHIRTLVAKQKQELEDTRAKLVWVDKELKDKEPQIEALGKERDWFKLNYEKDHEKVLKQEATILKLYIAIGVMALFFGLYAFAKFYLHLPI